MSQHTPGPWDWLKLLYGPNNTVVHFPHAPATVTDADQALIDAAPDLLLACKALVLARQAKSLSMVRDAIVLAEAAVLKATKGDAS